MAPQLVGQFLGMDAKEEGQGERESGANLRG